jgi:hypothetical protein
MKKTERAKIMLQGMAAGALAILALMRFYQGIEAWKGHVSLAVMLFFVVSAIWPMENK